MVDWRSFNNSFAAGVNSYAGIARLHQRQQQMQQQQKQQEIENDYKRFAQGVSLIDSKNPLKLQEMGAQIIAQTIGKDKPELVEEMKKIYLGNPEAREKYKKNLMGLIKDTNIPVAEKYIRLEMFTSEAVDDGVIRARINPTYEGAQKSLEYGAQEAQNKQKQRAIQAHSFQTQAAARQLEGVKQQQRIGLEGIRHENRQKDFALQQGITRGAALAKETGGGGNSKQITALKGRQSSQIASINAIHKKHNVGSIDINALLAMTTPERKQYLLDQSKTAAEKIKGPDSALLKRRYRILEKITDSLAGEYGAEERTVVRTGKIDGRNVIEYSDGAVEYAD